MFDMEQPGGSDGEYDESECVEAGLVEYCPTDNEPLHPQSTFIEGILST